MARRAGETSPLPRYACLDWKSEKGGRPTLLARPPLQRSYEYRRGHRLRAMPMGTAATSQSPPRSFPSGFRCEGASADDPVRGDAARLSGGTRKCAAPAGAARRDRDASLPVGALPKHRSQFRLRETSHERSREQTREENENGISRGRAVHGLEMDGERPFEIRLSRRQRRTQRKRTAGPSEQVERRGSYTGARQGQERHETPNCERLSSVSSPLSPRGGQFFLFEGRGRNPASKAVRDRDQTGAKERAPAANRQATANDAAKSPYSPDFNFTAQPGLLRKALVYMLVLLGAPELLGRDLFPSIEQVIQHQDSCAD
ncbi:hypothetical protein BESB_019290 [Besnoitia besnoiti]|uniref:Uncharacterized protein n=1 Tax=Besnoitia besnoiti TaxID=94643 RepID=A0A2A9M059_BESBE|nr:hypothetical protein BESB_019290 [Besnoitia besnoiti]PFH31988.1 hypothetical protein BESB_019290 [Besnoitia besnoiti]